MKRPVRHVILMAFLVSAALPIGCQRHVRHCSCCPGGPAHSDAALLPPINPPPPTAIASAPAVEVVPPPAIESPTVAIASHPPPAQPPRPASSPGHARDYSWLIGELRYVHVRDAWRLRYLASDEEDRLGGSVTLVETGPMTAYHSGQRVRVEGSLAQPHSPEPSPAYRLRSIQPHP